MSCDEKAEALSALIDRELAPEEASRLEAHLEGCAVCQARFDRLDRAAGLVGLLAEDGASPGFAEALDARLTQAMAEDGLAVDASPSAGLPRSGRQPRWRERPRAAGGGSWARQAVAAAVLLAAGYGLHGLLTSSSSPSTPARGIAPPELRPVFGDAEAFARRAAPGGPETAVGGVHEAGTRDAGGSAAAPAPSARSEGPDGSAPPAGGPSLAVPGSSSEGTPAGATKPAPSSGEPGTVPASSVVARREEDPEAAARRRREEVRALVRRFRAARATEEERASVLYELAARGGADAITLLREVVVRRPARYGRLRDEAIAALGAYPSEDGVWILLQAARTEPARVRAALGAIEAPALLATLARRVLPALDEARYPDARLLLADALAARRADGAASALGHALRATRDRMSRVRLLLALGRVGDAEAAGALASSLGARVPSERAAAACALGRAEAPIAEAVIGRLVALGRGDRYAEVRAAAVRALGGLPGAEAASALVAARAKDKAALVRSEAQLALMQRSGEGLYAPNAWERWRSGAGQAALAKRAGPLQAVLPAGAAPESYHGIPVISDGVVFLVDGSDSMRRKGKLERAQRELQRTLEALPRGTRFTVGVFSDEMAFCFRPGLMPASANSVARAVRFAALGRRPGGRTDLGRALGRALSLRGVDQVFLLSDGAPTAGAGASEILDRVFERTWRQTVRVHVVGLYTGDGVFRVDQPEVPGPPPVAFVRSLCRVTGGVFVRND